ncbi:MAG: type II toxin-antitoxin system MqsA family antitoxin [Alphaproteobacteria bacterium]
MTVKTKKAKSQDSLLDSLHEVLEDVQGTKRLNSRSVNIEDIDVHGIRKKQHLTQAEFSRIFGFSLRTLQQWEQGRRKPHGSAKVLLKVIDYAPDVVDRALHSS